MINFKKRNEFGKINSCEVFISICFISLILENLLLVLYRKYESRINEIKQIEMNTSQEFKLIKGTLILDSYFRYKTKRRFSYIFIYIFY